MTPGELAKALHDRGWLDSADAEDAAEDLAANCPGLFAQTDNNGRPGTEPR